jgi:hypothetical protein
MYRGKAQRVSNYSRIQAQKSDVSPPNTRLRVWVTGYYVSLFCASDWCFVYWIICLGIFRSLLCSSYSFCVWLFILCLFELFCMSFCFVCSVFWYCFVYFLLMYAVVSFLFVCKCMDHCHRVETQVQLHKYHIISTRVLPIRLHPLNLTSVVWGFTTLKFGWWFCGLVLHRMLLRRCK